MLAAQPFALVHLLFALVHLLYSNSLYILLGNKHRTFESKIKKQKLREPARAGLAAQQFAPGMVPVCEQPSDPVLVPVCVCVCVCVCARARAAI